MLEEVGQRIREIRKEKGIRQEDLAREIGYKNAYSVHMIEYGKNDTLCITMLMRIGAALGVDWQDFV